MNLTCRPCFRRECSQPPAVRSWPILFAIVAAFFLAFETPSVFALDDHNPIGVTGVFEGVITTGCAYNVLNHNARRGPIDDIVVPSSIGKYPLKMTRYYNSRRTTAYGLMGPGWSHEYLWISVNEKVEYPNGNVWDSHCFGDLGAPLGVSDWPGAAINGHPTFKLADGGTVVFGGTYNSIPIQIIDPYGQTTTITYYAPPNDLLISRVTEPGGRYLQFTYNASQLLTRVEAHGLGNASVTDWVVYHYTATPPGGGHPSVMCLTSVDYSDGQHASYAYEPDNVPEDPNNGSIKAFPLVSTCNDVRYSGPMRQIAYDYQDQGAHGAIVKEKYSANGPMVSSISVTDPDFPTVFTETRGDSPIRTFTYTPLHLHRFNEDTCPTLTFGPAPQQFLQSYTDFQNHTTQLDYDANWYVDSVTDANNHTTSYLRGPPPNAYPGPKGIGQILRITHPDNTHIDYTYYDESPNISGHYLKQITDERGNITYHYRDANHRIYRTDHKDWNNNIVAFEQFWYANNNFGLLSTHHLPSNTSWSGPYLHFKYDNCGLLIAKTNPTTQSDWATAFNSPSVPKTTYTYYTTTDGKVGWIDRVKTMTLPANGSGNVATETYEYDLSANNTSRGLVTKIQHADGKYQSFGYDVYGNKLWEENELRNRTSYTYDDYNRLLTTTNALNKTATYTYKPTNGNGTNPYLHTTNNPDTITTPTGIVTTNDYDQNFRKTSTTVGSSITRFGYDNVGNPTTVTDPLNHTTTTDYDTRNRKWDVWDALNHRTMFTYDGASNVIRIDHPDGGWETKAYDGMNRLGAHSVYKSASETLTTRFGYWPSGKLFWVIDPKQDGGSLATYFAYNESDQMIAMYYPDPNLTTLQQWSYDDAHNLASHTTVSGDKTEQFTYDNRNRKRTMTCTTATQWIEWANYLYDDASHLTTVSNGTGASGQNVVSIITRQYDGAGHLTSDQQNVTGLGTKNVTYPSYDDDGKLKRIFLTGGGYDYSFGYDTMGRFETITPTGGSVAFQYYYDAASNETKRRTNLSGGVYVDKLTPRDSLNRISRRDLQKSGTEFSAEAYTYDAMSRLTSVTYGSVSDQYGYYNDGELYWVKYNLVNGQNPNRTVTYVFDKAGNRIGIGDTVNGNSLYTTDDLNEYAAVTGTTIHNGSEHEVDQYKGPNDTQQVDYAYLTDQQLVSVTSGSNSYSLAYDALNRCVRRTLNGVTTYYVYDGEKPILEYTNGTLVKNLYGKEIDEILMRTDPTVNSGQSFYYEDNHEGSITHLINGSGNVIESYRYDVFGALTNINYSNYKNRFLFTGREYAGATATGYNAGFKFYEYRARAYHPQLGRFMSEDPKLFDAGDYNLFRYCHNDPLDLTDPMGLEINWGGNSPLNNHNMSTMDDRAYNFIMGLMQRQFSSAISAGMAGYQAYQGWSAVQGHNFIMAQMRSSKAQGDVQYRYSTPQGHQPHRTDLKDGGADFHWQLNEYYPDSKTLKALKEYGWGNREIEIGHTGNIGTVDTSTAKIVPLSSQGILSDRVGPVVLNPGGTVHGTVTLRNDLYQRIGNVWSFVPGMTTQFTHTYDRGANGAWNVDSEISSP